MKNTKLLVLVKKAKNQNQKAFAKLCELKVNEVIFLCVREMGNPEDGQDAAQEVFIQMQKSLPALREPEAFNVWLNRLIHNTCLTMKRKNTRTTAMLNVDNFEELLMDTNLAAMPQDFIEEADTRQRVLSIIDTLPEKYRMCITLHYFQNLNYAEIAEVLDIDKDAVNNNMRMARKHIKRRLERESSSSGNATLSAAMGPLIIRTLLEAAQTTVTPAAAQDCLIAAGVPTLQAAAGGISAKAAAAVVTAAITVAAGTGVWVSKRPASALAPNTAPALTQPTQLSGHIALTLGGVPQEYQSELLQGVHISLYSPDGDLIATTPLSQTGEYSFADLSITQAGLYTLHVTAGPGALITLDIPDETLYLWPGYSTE